MGDAVTPQESAPAHPCFRAGDSTPVDPSTATAESLLAALDATAEGLTSAEAARRLAVHGPNEIRADAGTPWWLSLLGQFRSPLVLILIGASVVAFILGDHTQTTIIAGMVVLGAVLAFAQEWRSERAVSRLRERLGRLAFVARDGAVRRIDARELVPGDVLLLGYGTVVAADARLLHVDDLEMDEAVLTGESVPVVKTAQPLARPATLPQDRRDIAFAGTSVVRGNGRALVFATGAGTEMARTASLLQVRTGRTRYEEGIDRFGRFLLNITLALCALVFITLGALRGEWTESLLFALALAVGIAPELLPVVVTVNLSLGALALGRRRVLVKRLSAIEDLGNADVLCTDKTGTLTEGQLRVTDSLGPDGAPHDEALAWMALCTEPPGLTGAANPIDQAILEAVPVTALGAAPARLEIIAFDFQRRRMGVVAAADASSPRWLVVKGAAHEVLAVCDRVAIENPGAGSARLDDGPPGAHRLDPGGRDRLLAIAEREQSRGRRVLAVGRRPIESRPDYGPEVERSLEFLGFVLLGDTPKESSAAAVADLATLGVRVVVLTGDTEPVTRHIADAIGLSITGVVSGPDVEGMDDAQLAAVAAESNVFVRVTPAHKLRIMHALRGAGRTVAFMGDGVNDAPSLRAADVGISFQEAVDVAREAAGVVLLEKDLGVLAEGIRQGRRIFRNTRTYILSTISSNFGNMLTVAGASLMLPFLPMLPTQILLLNLLSDLPMLAISADRVGDEELARPSRWDIGAISGAMYFFGVISSFADYATFGLLLWVTHADMISFRSGWFIESMLTELVVIFLLRTFKPSWRNRPATLLLVAAVLTVGLTFLLFVTPAGAAFGLAPQPPRLVGAIVAIVILYAVLTEAGKRVYVRLHRAD